MVPPRELQQIYSFHIAFDREVLQIRINLPDTEPNNFYSDTHHCNHYSGTGTGYRYNWCDAFYGSFFYYISVSSFLKLQNPLTKQKTLTFYKVLGISGIIAGLTSLGGER